MGVQQFKALCDESRMNILKLLLERNYCVGALAQKLHLSESAVSQHIKVMREAGLLEGQRHGYFMHYDVKYDTLHQMGEELHALARIKRQVCEPEIIGCGRDRRAKCQCRRHENKNGVQKPYRGHRHKAPRPKEE